MSEHVEISRFNIALFYITFKPILHSARLNVPVGSCQNVCFGIGCEFLRNINDEQRQRNLTNRTLAFGFCDDNFRLPNNFYLLMMMIELVFVGAYKILVNLIPHKTNGVPNDGYIVKMLDAHIAMRKDYALYLRIYADTFLNKAISPSDYQYERNESLSDDELLYYNEIQEILKSINAQMSKHEIDHCKGIVI